jgi:anti-sigma regulatory factor (Ser/Thr protein kinase)
MAGAHVLSVRGPVVDSDADGLRVAIADAVALCPRGVVVDLSEATDISAAALEVLRQGRTAAPGWPRPGLVICTSSAEVTAALQSWLPVHAHRDDGLAHIDDRSSQPRRTMQLDSSPSSPARARALAADAVADLQLGSVADDVALVVSELVTNAIRHAEPPVELEIETGEYAVVVAVADCSSDRPVARHAPEDAEGGRGLELIDLVASETGVRPEPPGKTVWAAVQRP